MIKIKYDSWDKVTVNVYDRLQSAVANAEVTGIEEVDLVNKEIAIIATLADVDEDAIADLTHSEFVRLSKQCNFISQMPKVDIRDNYTLNGKKYNVFRDIQNMTMSQYVDFQLLYKDRDKNFKQLLACFLIPKGKQYGEYNVAEVIEDIGNHLSITDANSILFFFVIAFQSLIKTMVNYSIKQMKKLMKQEKDRERAMTIKEAIEKMEEAANLANDGVGFTI